MRLTVEYSTKAICVGAGGEEGGGTCGATAARNWEKRTCSCCGATLAARWVYLCIRQGLGCRTVAIASIPFPEWISKERVAASEL